MAGAEKLKVKAETCLAKKVDIPSSPLWHMGKAAKLGAGDSFKVMQDAIDYLTCKAKAKLEFNDDDKEFLKELYEAFWWGGQYNGLKEAAQLANHYVNGDGKSLKIDPEIYQTAPVVISTMIAMKFFMAMQLKKKRSITRLRCDDVVFRASTLAAPLRKMNYLTEGKMKSNGVLEAAQQNQRLHKADGHFYLDSFNVVGGKGVVSTTWSVKSIYDFEPFEKHDYYTEIPLGKFKLILPDGLSEYMTKIGVAKVFEYSAEWKELWSTNR